MEKMAKCECDLLQIIASTFDTSLLSPCTVGGNESGSCEISIFITFYIVGKFLQSINYDSDEENLIAKTCCEFISFLILQGMKINTEERGNKQGLLSHIALSSVLNLNYHHHH